MAQTFPARVDGEITQGGFNCYTDTIDAGESPLTIQAGDILGACVFNPEDTSLVNTFPLDVVGKASGESLLRMGTAGCSGEDIPSDILSNQLSTLNSKRLHIYVNIGKAVLAHVHQLHINELYLQKLTPQLHRLLVLQHLLQL